jgi:hypothetical protein
MAAVLAAGPHACVSHRDAGQLLGLRASNRALIDVTVSGRRARKRRGIDLHYTHTLLRRDVLVVDGIPCTSVARTLLDLAEVVDGRGVEKAVERAEILRVFDLRALEDVLERAAGRRGAWVLRSVLADFAGVPPTRNELEHELFAFCGELDLPKPEVNVWIDLGDGGAPIEADFVFRDAKVMVEADGYETHGTRTAFERDRERDQRLAYAEWHVIRCTWRQVMSRSESLARALSRAVARRMTQPAQAWTR